MPDFRTVQTPRSPGRCVFCGSFDVVLIEPVPELVMPGYGYVYVCADNTPERSGCLVQAARVVGCLGLEESDRLFEESIAAQERASLLKYELDRRADPVVLPREEFERLVQAATIGTHEEEGAAGE